MGEHIRKTMAEIQQQIREIEVELKRKRQMVNDLAGMAGMPHVYANVEENTTQSVHAIRPDQWYGQNMSKAIREYLEMRRAADQGPATVNEIFDALMQGGFNFEAKNDENAKRSLRISLTKNTSIFHRLPDRKHYGLVEWYPDIKNAKRATSSNKAKDNGGGEAGESADDEESTLGFEDGIEDESVEEDEEQDQGTV